VVGADSDRRGSEESDRTAYSQTEQGPYNSNVHKYTFSSYQHPYDIAPPASAHNSGNLSTPQDRRAGRQRAASFAGGSTAGRAPFHDEERTGAGGRSDDSVADTGRHEELPEPRRYRGLAANLMELRGVSLSRPRSHGGGDGGGSGFRRDSTWDMSDFSMSRGASGVSQGSTGGWGMGRMDSNLSLGSGVLDPDDPKITGATKMLLDDPKDLEENCKQQMDLKHMNYKQRRKEAQKMRIEFNVTCASCS